MKLFFLHFLGSVYEIGTGQSFILRKLRGTPRYPSKAETALLNAQAARSI